MAVGPSVDGWGTEFPDGVVFVEVFDDAFAAAISPGGASNAFEYLGSTLTKKKSEWSFKSSRP